jgi:hypothetical protein
MKMNNAFIGETSLRASFSNAFEVEEVSILNFAVHVPTSEVAVLTVMKEMRDEVTMGRWRYRLNSRTVIVNGRDIEIQLEWRRSDR